jgi:hypothetical protein
MQIFLFDGLGLRRYVRVGSSSSLQPVAHAGGSAWPTRQNKMLDRSRGDGPRKWCVDRPRPGQHGRYAFVMGTRLREVLVDLTVS